MRLATRMFNFRQNGGSNPLDAYACDWIRQQANPSLDYIGGDTNNPQVDVVDSAFLMYAVSLKYRFVDQIQIQCDNDDLQLRS